jgi:nicotinamidase-related amidase
MGKVLLVIDLQNDYFPGGRFPLWNAEATLASVEDAIRRARDKGIPVVLVQHLADADRGPAPFFNPGTEGAALHPRILAAAPEAPVVVKTFADAFEGTTLGAILARLGATELVLCGMMTQNCVTHTALSRAADAYGVTILPEGCTTVDEMIHLLALNAISTRVKLLPAAQAL